MLSKFTYPWVRRMVYITIFNSIYFSSHSQLTSGTLGGGNDGTYSLFPINNQLFPRDINTNLGTVKFKGNIITNRRNIRIEVFRDDNKDGDYDDLNEKKSTISIGDGPISFDETYQIPAELYNYRFTLIHDNGGWLERSNIVAGDAYYIQGQSNAEARPIVNTDRDKANDDPIADKNFVRVYGGGKDGYTKQWGIANANNDAFSDFNLGQFGMRLAKRIIQKENIPISIINGAERDFDIDKFLRKESNKYDLSTNYGRELTRATEGGLIGKFRAMIWYQGETNAVSPYILSTNTYKSKFQTYLNAWQSDFGGALKYYIIQIRPGCNDPGENINDILAIQQAHKELASNPGFDIVSTNNILKYTGDYCHYLFDNGYKIIGDRVFNLINRDFYGGSISPDEETPVPTLAFFSGLDGLSVGANQVEIHFKNPSANLAIVNNVLPRLRLRGEPGTSYTITGASIVNNLNFGNNYKVLRIDFQREAGTITNPTVVDFLSEVPPSNGTTPHPPLSAIATANGTGIGMLSFSGLPIGLGILPVDPLALRVSSTGSANRLVWEVENNQEFESFNVERSLDGSRFETLYQLEANGQQ